MPMPRQAGLYQAVTMLRQVGLCLYPNRLGCDYVHNQYPMPFIISLVMITLIVLLPRKFLDFTFIYSPFLFHWYLYSFHWYSATHLVLVTQLSALPHLYWLLICQLYLTCTGYSFVSSTSLVLVTYLSALLHLQLLLIC